MQTALLALLGGAITQLVLFAFTYGRMTKTVSVLAENVNDHEKRLRIVERAI